MATDGSVASALRALAERGLQSVLVEGGPRVHAAFAEAGMIDEVQVFVAQDVFLPDGLPFAPTVGTDAWPGSSNSRSSRLATTCW